MVIMMPISVGELIDKITILEIKSVRIVDVGKLENIRKELELLEHTWKSADTGGVDITAERAKLKEINEALWDIEDKIRVQEKANNFDDTFVQLARSVYVTNDQRAGVKRTINLAVGSDLVEEKSYQPYK